MKSLWKYLNERDENMRFLLVKTKNVVTPLIFQKVSVEIEKLNAFYGLLKFSDSKFRRKKTFKPFKKLAGLVEEVSSLQREESMLNQLFSKEQLVGYKRDVRKLKEMKREDYFSIVNEKFVSILAEKKSEVEPILRSTGKKIVAEFLKKKRKKVLKIIGKSELNESAIEELRTKLKGYNYLKTLITKAKSKKDDFELLLDAWNQNQSQIAHVKILMESGVFDKKELVFIKKVEAKLAEKNAELVNNIKARSPLMTL
jgi:hypothetical protein